MVAVVKETELKEDMLENEEASSKKAGWLGCEC